MIEPWLFMNWKKTAEYLLTSQTLSASDVLEAGIVNKVVPRDELEQTVEDLAAKVANAPGSTLIATKSLIRRAGELMGMRVHQQMSNDLVTVISAHGDFKDKMAEIVAAKKKPREIAK